MPLRPFLLGLALCLTVASIALAQNRVRTERIAPPAPDRPAQTEAHAEDLARLPAAVAQTRERILAAARSGDLEKLVTVMQMNETMPIFASSAERDPIAVWKAAYPESEGLEVLAILSQILDCGYSRIGQGTPQEMYVWPYLAGNPLRTLSPPQRVDLLRLVTGADYRAMLERGQYNFYRLGIAPDGTWHFFITGD